MDWDILHESAARQQGALTSVEARLDLVKEIWQVVFQDHGRELVKEGVKGKAKAGWERRSKAASTTKVDLEKEVVRVIKGRVGHVVRWATKRAKGNVEAKVMLIGQSRKLRTIVGRQCKVWKLAGYGRSVK